MKPIVTFGAAIAAMAIAAFSFVPAASAAGLFDGMRGSMKDTVRSYGHASVGRCYLRGDVGYSVGGEPVVHVTSPDYSVVGTTDEDMGGAWMGEIGIGCGSGSRGFRADFTLGYRWDHDVTGYIPGAPDRPYAGGNFETSVKTLTGMANVYYDFGQMRGFVPYVGAGIGWAAHDMATTSTTIPNSTNVAGDTSVDLAWSLMAGFAYQVSERAVLDFGYRFIHMGDVDSKRGNFCACARDAVSIEDMTAHEFKVGLRYHFGGRRAPIYGPTYK